MSKPKTVQNSSYGSQSTSRKVALAQAEKGNWYASIVSEVEGYRSRPYFDNKGIAIGNGWNIGQQSRKRNTELAFGIEMDGVSTEALLPYSGVQNPTSLPNVAITPEQSSKAVELMREQYEAPMRKLVPSWSQLKRNEQDALVYHAYKVGAGGAAKYTSMLAALKTYAANPSEENKLKVAGTFTYKYTINGTVYQDARSALYLGALFTSPEAYTYLLGTTKAPADFGKVAQLSGQKIDTSKPAEDQIQDDYGKAKEVLISRGIPYTVILQAAPQATAPAPTKPRVRNNAIVFWGI
ncbi:lysozyme family protein [Diaphorobacter aerolatus]|uniref:Glycoside hydrolase family protein n=1 Tax=Diaphorobacter aerolatus TaxID=1288495 RepID=A0A7H0GJA2_9BURK|nr:glycoside hydrolase family protein [Diaphorobacter aerolatus]QNP48368.1 glycoside hydrolase family protein [Diaphorobacter aerolatus]